MSDIDTRLRAIFMAAFPMLAPDNIETADRDRVTNWDSIASVTLATMIEEEFGCSLDFDHVAEWRSFADVRDSVIRSNAG